MIKVANQLRFKARRKHIAKLLPGKLGLGVVAKSAADHRNKEKWLLTTDMLDLAFGSDSHRSSKVNAAIFGISPRHSRRMLVYAADCFMTTQLKCLGALVKLCCERPPDIVISRLAWDETGEKLTLNVPNSGLSLSFSKKNLLLYHIPFFISDHIEDPSIFREREREKDRARERGTHSYSAEQAQSTWQVMMVRVRLVVIWFRDEDFANPEIVDWELVVPPIVVTTVSADQIYYGLFHAPMTRPLMIKQIEKRNKRKLFPKISNSNSHTKSQGHS